MRKPSLPTLFFLLEFGVLIVGVILVYAWPGPKFPVNLTFNHDTLQNLLWTSPVAVAIAVIATSRWGKAIPGVGRIYQDLSTSFMGDYIRTAPLSSFLLVSLAAGFGEEILFRGFLQGYLGIHGTSFFFGLLHAVSFPYFVVTTLMGYFFGWVYEWSGSQLMVPAILHAGYDFLALLLYRRRMKQESCPPPPDELYEGDEADPPAH